MRRTTTTGSPTWRHRRAGINAKDNTVGEKRMGGGWGSEQRRDGRNSKIILASSSCNQLRASSFSYKADATGTGGRDGRARKGTCCPEGHRRGRLQARYKPAVCLDAADERTMVNADYWSLLRCRC
jgi:hypothetical protein